MTDNTARKAELYKQIRVLRAETLAIEAAERQAKNSALVGKCFKMLNSYSCPQTESDYWYVYTKVLDTDLNTFTFQDDRSAEFHIRIELGQYYADSDTVEIHPAEFESEWVKLLERITAKGLEVI